MKTQSQHNNSLNNHGVNYKRTVSLPGPPNNIGGGVGAVVGFSRTPHGLWKRLGSPVVILSGLML